MIKYPYNIIPIWRFRLFMSQKKIEKIQEAKIKDPKVKKERKPTDKLADKTTTTRILQGVFGDPAKRNLARRR